MSDYSPERHNKFLTRWEGEMPNKKKLVRIKIGGEHHFISALNTNLIDFLCVKAMKFEPESSDLPPHEHQRETRNHSLWAQQQLVPEMSSLLDFDGTSGRVNER